MHKCHKDRKCKSILDRSILKSQHTYRLNNMLQTLLGNIQKSPSTDIGQKIKNIIKQNKNTQKVNKGSWNEV